MNRVERVERERLSGRRRVNVARVITPLPPPRLALSLFLSLFHSALGHTGVSLSFSPLFRLFLALTRAPPPPPSLCSVPSHSSLALSSSLVLAPRSLPRTILLASLTVSSPLVHLTSLSAASPSSRRFQAGSGLLHSAAPRPTLRALSESKFFPFSLHRTRARASDPVEKFAFSCVRFRCKGGSRFCREIAIKRTRNKRRGKEK